MTPTVISQAGNWYISQAERGNPMLPRPEILFGYYRWGDRWFYGLLNELDIKFIGGPNVLYRSLAPVSLPKDVTLARHPADSNAVLLKKKGRAVAEIRRSVHDGEEGWRATPSTWRRDFGRMIPALCLGLTIASSMISDLIWGSPRDVLGSTAFGVAAAASYLIAQAIHKRRRL